MHIIFRVENEERANCQGAFLAVLYTVCLQSNIGKFVLKPISFQKVLICLTYSIVGICVQVVSKFDLC